MLASTMLSARPPERERDGTGSTYLLEKASDEELDAMIEDLEKERLNVPADDVEGHRLYQRSLDRMLAAKRRRHGPLARRSDRVRASALLGGQEGAQDPSTSSGY